MKRAQDNSSYSVQPKRRHDLTCNDPIMNSLVLAIKQRASLSNIKTILNDIQDVNVRNGHYSRTPLHLAISWNCEPVIIEELMSKGADINARDRIGMTPLHLAASSNRSVEYVPRLLSQGAEVNARNECGETPLYLAVSQFKKFNIIKMLLEHGADTDYVYDDFLSCLRFFTLLEKAVVLGAASSAKLLIKTIFLKNVVKDFSNVIQLKKHPRFNSHRLSKFMARCIGELVCMRKTKISPNHTVFDFALFGNNHNIRPLYTDPKLTDSQLSIMFPIYNEILKTNIVLALQRGQYMKQFRDLYAAKISNSQELILNFDCIEKICSYLTNKELLDFAKAFYVSL